MKCGVGDYTQSLAKALATLPEVKVGVLTNGEAEGVLGRPEIEVLPLMRRWQVREIFVLLQVLRKWKPDLVHIQYPTQGFAGARLPWLIPLLAFMLGKKVVQTWHEEFGRSSALLILKAIIPSKFVVVRPRYRDRMPPSIKRLLRNRVMQYIPSASAIPYADLSEVQAYQLRAKYLLGQSRLIVFFGFVYPNKRLEILFEIADPTRDQIVIAGELPLGSEYSRRIQQIAKSESWLDKVTVTGFLPATEVAALLRVADAVVLPFKLGGGEWNTSIHGALLQNTFVLTTSDSVNGYDSKRNIYFSRIDDVDEMSKALEKFSGMKRSSVNYEAQDEWRQIAKHHFDLYQQS
jgi:glycosyltransferase involved in cell wall biosynthesis